MRGRSEKRTVGNEGGGRRERREKETLPRSDKKVNWRRDKARLLRGCGPRRRATLISLVGPLHDRAEKSYEEHRCADKNGIFRIDSPFNPIRAKIPRRSLKKREASVCHLRQSCPRKPELLTRLRPLLRAATRSRQIRSTFSTSSEVDRRVS